MLKFHFPHYLAKSHVQPLHKTLIFVESERNHNKQSCPKIFEKANSLTWIHHLLLLVEDICYCTKPDVTIYLSQNKLAINIFGTFLLVLEKPSLTIWSTGLLYSPTLGSYHQFITIYPELKDGCFFNKVWHSSHTCRERERES